MPATLTKREVEYQNKPKGDEQCGKCTMFRRPNDCTLVKGYILVQGWCKEFDPK